MSEEKWWQGHYGTERVGYVCTALAVCTIATCIALYQILAKLYPNGVNP